MVPRGVFSVWIGRLYRVAVYGRLTTLGSLTVTVYGRAVRYMVWRAALNGMQPRGQRREPSLYPIFIHFFSTECYH